ncbi:MAG: ribose 5-phosphate isomerase B [Patescibacteria group bacterium]|nr:ribose 5-phosphate isomerase B [Patescibacteria group bacterium]
MRIYLGSDHAGYAFKENLQKHLKGQGHSVVDLGAFNEDDVDYPDIAHEVTDKVVENPGAYGILICGTGIGMSMASNDNKRARAALCTDEHMAEMARKHNNANMLCMGARVIDSGLGIKIADKFLNTEFESHEERHVRRVNKIKRNV